MPEDTEVKRPIELHRHRRQRRRHSVTDKNLLDCLQMIRPYGIARAFACVTSERTEDRLGGGSEEFPILPETCEFGPDEGEQLFFQRFIVALFDLTFGALKRFGDCLLYTSPS